MIRDIIERGISFGSKIAESLMSKGDVKYLILNSLSKKPMHGYQIITSINEEFLGLYNPSPGTIYPALQMLEEQELIKTKGNEGKKVYELTNKGEKYVKENKKEITRIMESIKKSELLPHIKKLALEMQELTKETMKLATSKAKEGIKKTEENIKETREIIKDTIKKVRETWKE